MTTPLTDAEFNAAVAETMDNELNAAVAEKVFGWVKVVIELPSQGAWGWNKSLGGCREAVPNYATNPTDDYEVLVFVRDTWSRDRQEKMWDALESKWVAAAYDEWPALGYQPGDYARAALAALGDET